jgi:hypothetical protein
VKKFALTTAAFGALAAAALGLAGAATAAPLGGSSAADAISTLKAEGYNVQLNEPISNAPLSECTVTGVHGLPSNSDSVGHVTPFTTVYVDVNCPQSGTV